MAFQAEQKIKADILRSLSTEQLFRLLSDSDLNVLMKTLGLLRNLLSTRPVSNAPGVSIAQHLCMSTMLFIPEKQVHIWVCHLHQCSGNWRQHCLHGGSPSLVLDVCLPWLVSLFHLPESLSPEVSVSLLKNSFSIIIQTLPPHTY